MSPRAFRHTDIKQAGAIFLLVDNVVSEDLVIQGPRFCLCGRHVVQIFQNEVQPWKIGDSRINLYFAARAMSLGSF